MQNLSFPFLTVLFHFLLPLLTPLLQLVHWRKYFLLVPFVKTLLIGLHLLENFIRVLWHFLLQFFQLFLELAILSHCDLVRHIEITLLLRVAAHEGP